MGGLNSVDDLPGKNCVALPKWAQSETHSLIGVASHN
uniref:Uncharacterized protein n=1 Tax=Anguilla anguilla TaxID=7936 RepID=A0A0E9PF74_ANGAN